MNAGISTGANPVFSGDFGLGRTAPLMAAFVVVGLVLLYVANKICRRTGPHRHTVNRFTKKS
jgi:hypothetical protein